ncbi:prepilin-type N-terminal cleavage/methylation domain-containing protein [Methylobacillus rhizosphaerae]|uniref:Prepilin-type N-terminal cleavage/methylation domain-containing protein n=1 Tax=Methylobacillus rhizosphaerae TaxID=551994 RepID=A0A238Z5Q1_9PROT|nr:prepilin-type N-terminal cleavage/methylation domain-containing protein [Methylobacillus rhizosphaerae]SNR78329.1 prepilin-type N-terminal cleavage/methylation domain-containing protein [Methylobacillus rhizosphaerae]
MNKSSGFTLIELAIVLVIIGLLLGGVLKGQELINSAKVKNLAADFKNVQVYLYGYQDKFRALPGDDAAADVHLAGATKATTGAGNGIINGNWDASDAGAESILFWQHVRLAGFAPGITIVGADVAAFVPRNAEGGRIGIQSIAGATNLPTPAMSGSYAVCSANISGKFARQIDVALDDGETSTGSVRAYMVASEGVAWVASAGESGISNAAAYNVCMSF